MKLGKNNKKLIVLKQISPCNSNPTLHSQRYPLVKLEAAACAGVRSVQLFSQGLSAQPSMSIWQEIPVNFNYDFAGL